MFSLIPGFAAAAPRPSWWNRHVVSDTHREVSDTHRESDRPHDPAGFFRMLVACVALSVPFWVVVALLLREAWR